LNLSEKRRHFKSEDNIDLKSENEMPNILFKPFMKNERRQHKMERIRKIVILLVMVNLTIGFIASQSSAETPVIGFIAQDTTWTQANSPYVTLGNIIVQESLTLTIEPGVTVLFDSGHSLTIEGTLIARGTDKQGIEFTPKGEKKPGAWGGILFEDSSSDARFDDAGNYISGSILQYCTVEFAKTAVNANSASPFIDHCVIRNNTSGGISISNGDIVVIQDNTVVDNSDSGISLENSESIILIGNTVVGNTAKNIGGLLKGYTGGGIHVEDSTGTITKNTLIRNIAPGWRGYGSCGGSIYVENSTVTITNNILTGNIATGGGWNHGGGIYVENSTVYITNNTLTGNTATSGMAGHGGGIYVKSGTVTITDNTLTGNTADYYGGAIHAGGDTIISDNTITENRSKWGAAIDYSGSREITGNLIANNVGENAVYIKSNPMFTRNAIIDNQTKYNLYYARSKGSPNLNATNNYWEVTTEVEVRIKIYDFFIDNSKAAVDVIPFWFENPLPLGSLAVSVSPKALPADGKSTATITATLKDSKGNPVVNEPLTMVVSQGTSNLSAVKNNGDGVYTAMYTASRTVGNEIIWVIAPNSRLAKSVEIELTEPGALPPKTLSIPDTEAAAGGAVDIPVEIDDITGVAKADIELSYDAKFLEVQDVNGTDLIKGLTLTTKADVAGKLTISLAGAKGLAGGSGVMFHITLKIAKDAPVGETEIKLESIALYDEAGKEIPSTGTNGKLNVKEYQPISSFKLSLDEGINIVSLPLQPQTPFTARSFAEKLGLTMLISYNTEQDEFIPFVPDVFEGDGFSIEGGKGYIVNALESKEVTFTGTAWSNAPSIISPSPSKANSHWAFVVCGTIYDESQIVRKSTKLTVTVENLRTGSVAEAVVNQLEQGKFAIALVDMNRKAVVVADELMTVHIADAAGNVISGPITHRISAEDIAKGYTKFNMRLGDIIPEKSALLQNYPNPFNPETWIPYQLAQDGNVAIRIYNINGQLVRAINLGYKGKGFYLSKDRAAHWDGMNKLREKVSSGVYIYSIDAGNFRATRRMLIVK